MQQRRHTLLAIGAAALAAFGAFAPAVHAQDKPKVALVMKSLANEFFRTMEDGAKAHNKEHGNYVLLSNGIKNETDTAAQIKMVEQMVAQKADAIVIAPADSKALVPVLKNAVDKGVIVVNIDNRLDPEALKEKNLNIPFVGLTTATAPSWWATIWPSNCRPATRSASSKACLPPPMHSSAPQASRTPWTLPR